MPDQTFLNTQHRGRIFSEPGVALCADQKQVIEIDGQVLVPDDDSAYVEFLISYGLQLLPGELTGLNAYGTAFHPGTVANSYQTMRHKVLNEGHIMKSYEPEKNSRDHTIGTIVAVEFPRAPGAGWTVKKIEHGSVPRIRAAAVIHKAAQDVPKIFREHMSGRHKWSVSIEVRYSLAESGFIISRLDQATKGQKELLAQTTPEEFSALGFGYVLCPEAPDELLDCYNVDKRMIDKQWGKLPVGLLKGGINGRAHYYGVGLVRYAAEFEAEVQQMLASDPNALDEMGEQGVVELLGAFRSFHAEMKKTVDTIRQ